jgi:anti-anti-sigma factor
MGYSRAMRESGDLPQPASAEAGSAERRAWRAAGGLDAGDHACCAFCTAEDQRGLVRRFAVDALDRGMRLLYLADGSTEASVLGALAAGGVDVGARRAGGQLAMERAAERYLAEGGFEPERQIERLADAAADARADGFRGLAVTAEMSWALTSGTDPESLVAYERAVTRVFGGGEVTALCQYDALAFPEELHRRVAGLHPLAISTGPAGTVATRGAATIGELADVEGLQLAGEIDAFSAPYVRARIGEHLAAGEDVVLDLAELTFADVGASRTFVELAEELDPGLRVVLEGSPPVVRRVLRLCRWDERPGLLLRDAVVAGVGAAPAAGSGGAAVADADAEAGA